MPIRVTCTKCHARFNVSEKFAGKEGPCPKCKTKIRVPLPSEEIKIEAPQPKGPTDTQGKAIINPIKRQDTVLSPVQITLIATSIVAFLILALILRFMVDDWSGTTGWLLLSGGAFLLAWPVTYVSYALFRDQEREGFSGNPLLTRVSVCALVYAAAWLLMPVAAYAFVGQTQQGIAAIFGSIGMFAAGTVAAMACFEFEWLMAAAHYGLYFGIALLGRVLAGLAVFPIAPTSGPVRPGLPSTTTLWHRAEDLAPELLEFLAMVF